MIHHYRVVRCNLRYATNEVFKHIALDEGSIQIIFLFLHQNVSCGYSLEMSCQADDHSGTIFSVLHKK